MKSTVIPGLSEQAIKEISDINKPRIAEVKREIELLKSIIKDYQNRLDKLEPLVKEMATWY